MIEMVMASQLPVSSPIQRRYKVKGWHAPLLLPATQVF